MPDIKYHILKFVSCWKTAKSNYIRILILLADINIALI